MKNRIVIGYQWHYLHTHSHSSMPLKEKRFSYRPITMSRKTGSRLLRSFCLPTSSSSSRNSRTSLSLETFYSSTKNILSPTNFSRNMWAWSKLIWAVKGKLLASCSPGYPCAIRLLRTLSTSYKLRAIAWTSIRKAKVSLALRKKSTRKSREG
jgi:hypothetical protein